MEKPKKSKAFIITFILVLILLLVAYFLFSKKDSIFKTDGISFGRIFEPLVVSPEQTKLDVIRDRIFLENNPSDFDPNNNPNNFPVVTITNDPISVQKGGSSTISWTSTNTNSCKTSDGTLVGTSGSISTGALNDSKSFSISCTGNNGTTSANTKIKTGSTFGDLFKFPVVSISAYPSTIKKGESSTISWNSNNTDSCFTEEGKGTGTSGSFSTGALNETRVYSITCTGKYGTSGANAFVTVKNESSFICTNEGVVVNCNNINPTDQDTVCKEGGVVVSCFNFSDFVCTEGGVVVNCNNINPTNQDTVCKEGGVVVNCWDGTPTQPNNENNSSLAQCADGIDNDGKEGTDDKDPSCHSDFNEKNASSYDKKIADESRTKTNTECGDGINNDNQEGPDYQDKDCYINGVINYPDSYDKYMTPEKGGLPTPGDNTGDTFCAQNKITKELKAGSSTNDKAQVISLQTLLSKFTSPSLGRTYLNTTDIDGVFGGLMLSTTRIAVARFQADNNLNADKKMGNVDQETMNKLNSKCEELFGTPKICSNPKAVNYPDCNKCLNGSTNTTTCELEKKEVNKCAIFDQYPLEFTIEEKAKLAELLRKFYLLAPTLKTEDDLNLVYNEIDRYKGLIEQVSDLTTQCYKQTGASYTGPKTRFGNPWFRPTNIGSYIDEENASKLFPAGIKNTDSNYTLKLKAGDLDIYTPFVIKKPTAQGQGHAERNYVKTWKFDDDFDLNKVMLDRLREFELLLYIW